MSDTMSKDLEPKSDKRTSPHKGEAMLIHTRCGKEITTDPKKLSPGYQSACEWCDEDLYNFEIETITPPVEAIAKHLGYGKTNRESRPAIAGRAFEDAQALAIAELAVEALKQNGYHHHSTNRNRKRR